MRANATSTRFAAREQTHHAATVDTASLTPDFFASLRQFAATVLHVRFGSFYRHAAPRLLVRPLPASRPSSHRIIMRLSRIVLSHLFELLMSEAHELSVVARAYMLTLRLPTAATASVSARCHRVP